MLFVTSSTNWLCLYQVLWWCSAPINLLPSIWIGSSRVSLPTSHNAHSVRKPFVSVYKQVCVGNALWEPELRTKSSELRTQFENPLCLRIQTSDVGVMPCENQTPDTWGLMSLTNGYKFKVRPVPLLRTGVREASLKPRNIFLGWEDGTHNYQQRGALDAKEDDAEEIIWVVVCQDVAPYGEHQRASIKQHFERWSIKSAECVTVSEESASLQETWKLDVTWKKKFLCRMRSLDVVFMLIARLLISFCKALCHSEEKKCPDKTAAVEISK